MQERDALLLRCEEDLKETRACLESRSRELEEAREEAQREERERRSRELEEAREDGGCDSLRNLYRNKPRGQ